MKYSENYINHKKESMTKKDFAFCKWMDRVEKIVYKKINLYLLDLADEMFMEYYIRRTPATKMAMIVINEHDQIYELFH